PELLHGDSSAFRYAAERRAEGRVGKARLLSLQQESDLTADIELMYFFFRSLQDALWTKDGHRWTTEIDLMGIVRSQPELDRWQAGLQASRRWRTLHNASLVLRKGGRSFRFSDLSSGEQQIIGTNARLLAEIAPYSLVIID